MSILVLAAILSAYELLWAMAVDRHPELPAQYKLVNESDHPVSRPTPEHVDEHYVREQLDGRSDADYALVVVPCEGEGYAVLAVLTRGRSDEVVAVIDRADGRAEAVTLAAERARGARQATIVVTPLDGSVRRFEWNESGRRFSELPLRHRVSNREHP
jgi:hypothetical protein